MDDRDRLKFIAVKHGLRDRIGEAALVAVLILVVLAALAWGANEYGEPAGDPMAAVAVGAFLLGLFLLPLMRLVRDVLWVRGLWRPRPDPRDAEEALDRHVRRR